MHSQLYRSQSYRGDYQLHQKNAFLMDQNESPVNMMKYDTIPIGRPQPRDSAWFIPKQNNSRPPKNTPRIPWIHEGARPFISAAPVNRNRRGAFSIKFPWTRIATRRGPYLPLPALSFLSSSNLTFPPVSLRTSRMYSWVPSPNDTCDFSRCMMTLTPKYT